MSEWYHAKNGKSIGPFSFEDMKSLVEREEIGAMDLVFKRGEETWKPLRDWSEFSFAAVQVKNDENKLNQWIVYTRQGGEDRKIGPCSSETIQKKLAKGELSYEDFLWKEGMSDWYQIRSLKEFLPKTKVGKDILNEDKTDVLIENEIEIYNQPAVELLKNVKIKDAKQIHELTKTLTQSKTAPIFDRDKSESEIKNKNVKESEVMPPDSDKGSRTDLELSRAELIEKRRELDALMKKIFGESDSGEELTKLEKAKYLSQTVEELTNQLPVKKTLREKGYYKEETKPPADKSDGTDARGKGDNKKIHQLVNYIDNFSPEKKYNRQSIFQKIGNEVDVILPKGSLLRLFALFFTIFTFVIILILSSYNDQKEIRNPGDSQRFKGGHSEVSERDILAEINNEAKEPQKLKQKSQSLPPKKSASKLDIFLDSDGGKLDLIFKTDASTHYSIEVTIWANVKEVLGKGGFYYKTSLKGQAPYKLDLLRLNVPDGTLSVEASIGEITKKLKLNNFKDKKAFNRDLSLNKKQVAIWHQKEKRSLYAAINQLNEYALQLQSLVPLFSQGQNRWKKAYRNLKTRVSQSRSVYLRQVGDKVGGELVYPLIWLRVLEMEKEIIGLDSDPSGFDYLSFKKRIGATESEIAGLSLW